MLLDNNKGSSDDVTLPEVNPKVVDLIQVFFMLF